MHRELTLAECCDFFLLEQKALLPLTTYMTAQQYRQCLEPEFDAVNSPDIKNEEKGEVAMPIPIVLPVAADSVQIGDVVDLVNGKDCELFITVKAKLLVKEVYPASFIDELRAICQCNSFDESQNHFYCNSYLASIRERYGDAVDYVTGTLEIEECNLQMLYRSLYKGPPAIKAFVNNSGKPLVAFQTRNPLHRAHMALIQNVALSKNLTVCLHPTIGPTQPDDIPAKYRIACYRSLLDEYPKLYFSVIPLAMRMAGPREALLHCIIRQNFGFTHFIIGRDHAGPSSRRKDGTAWYNPMQAVEMCKKWQSHLKIQVLFGEEMVFVQNKGKYLPKSQVTTFDTVHNISGTELRQLLRVNQNIPDWFSYPDVLSILRKIPANQAPSMQGFCIQMSGLSGSGKSTLAEAFKKYVEETDLTRKCFILDGDVMRNYFKDLGFDRASRSMQTRRIGFIASLLAETGAVVVCANIAPYDDDRLANKQLFQEKKLQYLDVYVNTPIAICESRDPKGLYKKVRQGLIKNFTGIDDPYESPVNPDVILDTQNEPVTGTLVNLVMQLKTRGLLQ